MFSNEKYYLHFLLMSLEKRREMLPQCLIGRLIFSLLKGRNLEFIRYLPFYKCTSCCFSLNLFLKQLKMYADQILNTPLEIRWLSSHLWLQSTQPFYTPVYTGSVQCPVYTAAHTFHQACSSLNEASVCTGVQWVCI